MSLVGRMFLPLSLLPPPARDLASTSRARFSRHLPNGTRLRLTHMKSLTKINGANHASGYKSVAKFAQGPRGEDGLRYLCGSEQGGAGTSAVAAPLADNPRAEASHEI